MGIHQDVVDSVLSSRPDLYPLIENFSKSFDVTWAREIRLHGTDVTAFFIRLKRIIAEMFTILKNWTCFSHLERNAGRGRLSKQQLEILLHHVNANRQDAHPKPITSQDLATLRVVYDSLLSMLKAYEL